MIIYSKTRQNESEIFRNSNQDFKMSRNHQGAITNFPHVIVYHSPSGMDWGYSGSGPADTALNILFIETGDLKLADILHQEFKRAMISGLPYEGGIIKRKEVRAWLKIYTPVCRDKLI